MIAIFISKRWDSMNKRSSSRQPGIVVYLVALLSAAAGCYWGWSGLSSSDTALTRSVDERVPHAMRKNEPRESATIWTAGEMGKLITGCGLAVESLHLPADGAEMVVRTTGRYRDLYRLMRNLESVKSYEVHTLSLRRAHARGLIEGTISLRQKGSAR